MSAFRMKTKFFFTSLLLCACLASLTACDFTPPEIETLEVSVDYNSSVSVDELIASVTDNKEVASVVISEISPTGAEISEDSLSAVFPSPGDYTLTLTASDASGNETTAQAAVCVLDNIAPVFTYVPESAVVECGMPISVSSQSDASDAVYAVAKDEVSSVTLSFSDVEPASDEALDSFTFDSSTVTFTALGDYVVTLAAADSSGNLTTAALPVTVVDTTPPTILLTESSLTYTVGDNKPDYASFATAEDGVDGDVSANIAVDASAVNYKYPGTYAVTYSVSDNSGNKASQSLSLTVKAKESTASERTVYITNSGTKYHRAGCRFLNKSKIEISLSEAQAQGYTACQVCGG